MHLRTVIIILRMGISTCAVGDNIFKLNLVSLCTAVRFHSTMIVCGEAWNHPPDCLRDRVRALSFSFPFASTQAYKLDLIDETLFGTSLMKPKYCE